MRKTFDATLNASTKTLFAATVALAALGGADMAYAKGGDRAEQIEKLKAEQAKVRAGKGADSSGGFSFFGLLSDDDAMVEAKPAPATQ